MSGSAPRSDVIQNERIKLAATACNNLGVGGIIAGIVSPVVQTSHAGPYVAGWIAGAIFFFGTAQALLGRLR